MTYELEHSYIKDRFNTNWSETTVSWPNHQFDQKDLDEWVRLNIRNGQSVATDMGCDQTNYRHPGIIDVQIFVKPNSGATRALELADLVCAIWRGQSFNGITCYAPEIIELGVVEGWFQVNVSCPYYRDESF